MFLPNTVFKEYFQQIMKLYLVSSTFEAFLQAGKKPTKQTNITIKLYRIA